MSKYRYGIPSYKRAKDPRTVDLLVSLGCRKDEIIVSTQIQEDYNEYTKLLGDRATVIYRPAFNHPSNINTLMQYFRDGEPFIMVDDDISSFSRLVATEDGKNRLADITNLAELEAIFDDMFRYTIKNRGKIWAWYPVENPYFMTHTIDLYNILVSTIFGIINDQFCRFDESYDVKADFEISLRHIRAGMSTPRFNGFACKAKHHSPGGCDEFWKSDGLNEKMQQRLLKKYPMLVKPSSRSGEIRYTGTVKHEPETAAIKVKPKGGT